MFNAFYFDYPDEIEINIDTLKAKRNKLDKLYSRIEAFIECTYRTIDNDLSLSDADFEALDRAGTRLCEMLQFCEEAIEAVDDSIKAIETLESNARFIYRDCEYVLRKGA